MTKPKRYTRYSAEFKREAILRASEEGITDSAVCAGKLLNHDLDPSSMTC